ncbi:DUF397 domain-containing protein [Streptomyces sp. p1417]|uniref:DUF397 domain-containing protein n=1 Tax=Streptomyces typhae TaxID=2681492 RepID=A0A6L6WY34_9ACTN|nr:DUF397 domain-containing protein [Streptomyces typhae]MVO86404.1 DUF397 domain-containing protein [Streptomyces typhae]
MGGSTALDWYKSSYSGSEGGACLEAAYQWHKSSYSSGEGGACLEVTRNCRKSSHSGSDGGNCVQVAATVATVHIRDSKNPRGAHLIISPATWTAFLTLPQETRG